MSGNRWSHAEGDIVDVDVFDAGNEMCEQCNCVVDDDEVLFEEGDSYCADCYGDVFGDYSYTRNRSDEEN